MSDRNNLSITGNNLIVMPRGMDRVWGCRKQIIVPLASIADVHIEHRPHYVPSGWRGPGLDAFGKKCGTFHPGSERHYWNFSGKGSVLVIVISGGRPFDKLYLSVANVETSHHMLCTATNLG